MTARRSCVIFMYAAIAMLRLTPDARTASFDCAQAKSPREELICQDQTLSDLDSQLGQLYQARRKILSPHGAALLAFSERGWLRFGAAACPLEQSDAGGQRAKLLSCLRQRYRERLKELEIVGQRIGPFTFTRIDAYATGLVNGDQQADSNAQHGAWLAIDSPRSDISQAWNRLNLGADDPQGASADINYEIGYATARLISVRRNRIETSDSNAHPIQWYSVANTVLGPMVRPMTAEDVFGPGKAWRGRLSQLVRAALRDQGWTLPANAPANWLDNYATQADNWLFTPAGMNIAFVPGAVDAYAHTPAPVTLNWTTLKPLLARNAPVP